MFSLVLTSFLVVLYWSCARAEEVTHMPDVEELTLAPHVVKVMQNAEVLPPEHCQANMEEDFLPGAMGILDKAVLNENYGRTRGLPLNDITPCSRCRIMNEGFKLVKVEKLIDYRYLKDSYILDAYLRFPKIHLECDKCVLTDNGDKQHSGDFDIIWTEPLINVLAEDVYESSASQDWLHFLKFNGTNVNRDTVHVTCKGDDETFKEVCKSSDESGELDRVMHAASERLFKFEGKDFPPRSYERNLFNMFTTDLNYAFRCTTEA